MDCFAALGMTGMSRSVPGAPACAERNSYAISLPELARGTPLSAGRYLQSRASCLPQFDVKTLGLGHSGVFFHWSNRMVVKAIRHGAAVDKRASSSAPLKQDNDRVIETSIPARLDALRWSGFHTRVVLALGITWILDGLEVTLAGALSGALKESPTLQFSNFDVGLANSAYLAGAVLGALGFGWLTDRIGRKKLFFITLAVYLTATAATALSWSVASYALFRFLTGAGIGGEYTAINSTIQELVPARYRGWTDLVINGSFWIGAAIGAVAAIVLLDPNLLPPDIGWRLAYLIGAGSRPDRVRDADVDSGKPALADDPWPPRGGARDRRRHRESVDATSGSSGR